MLSDSSLIRMSPLQPSELPAHPSLTSTDSEAKTRPQLLSFVTALLDQASAILEPTQFNLTFKSHSRRPSPPSNTEVESLVATVASSTIADSVQWTDPQTGIGRQKPRDIPSENWFARRSYHANVSTKTNPATASWPEFVFGLRDNHSFNEMEFTPTLYDARHILDWNAELASTTTTSGNGNSEPEKYTHTTLAVYEMCHDIPFPLQPRCFAVLVATASVSPTKFIAATVPVNLGSFEGAFYSSGRNRTEGETSLRRKQAVMGLYTAVESCVLMNADTSAVVEGEGDAAKDAAAAGKEEQVEWIMATASDAKGNLPMALQKSTMPTQVAKDVGYFLSWIHTVDDAVLKGDKEYVSASASGDGERKRSRTGSSAR